MMFDEWEAVVYDLDGTLVRLAVDWDRVAVDALATFEEAGIDVDGEDLWTLLERSSDVGLRRDVEAVIAGHEVAGAREGTRLALADHLVRMDGPIGICSLNCEAACRVALSEHGLAEHVEVVIGRDSVDAWKPDPAPLEAAIRSLGSSPRDAIFVGDSERDAETARRADTAFASVEEVLERLC